MTDYLCLRINHPVWEIDRLRINPRLRNMSACESIRRLIAEVLLRGLNNVKNSVRFNGLSLLAWKLISRRA